MVKIAKVENWNKLGDKLENNREENQKLFHKH